MLSLTPTNAPSSASRNTMAILAYTEAVRLSSSARSSSLLCSTVRSTSLTMASQLRRQRPGSQLKTDAVNLNQLTILLIFNINVNFIKITI